MGQAQAEIVITGSISRSQEFWIMEMGYLSLSYAMVGEGVGALEI